jgi:hypothetical protein
MVTKEFGEMLTTVQQKLAVSNTNLAIYKNKLPKDILTIFPQGQTDIYEALNNSSKVEQLTHIAILTNNENFTESLQEFTPDFPDIALHLQKAVKAMAQQAQEEASSAAGNTHNDTEAAASVEEPPLQTAPQQPEQKEEDVGGYQQEAAIANAAPAQPPPPDKEDKGDKDTAMETHEAITAAAAASKASKLAAAEAENKLKEANKAKPTAKNGVGTAAAKSAAKAVATINKKS